MSSHAERIPFNALPRGSHVDLAEDGPKVLLSIDEKMSNTLNVLVNKEDHTLGNLLRANLHNNENVTFAAYRVKHPLDHKIFLKVQTIQQTSLEDSNGPKKAIDDAVDKIFEQLAIFSTFFEEELKQKRFQRDAPLSKE